MDLTVDYSDVDPQSIGQSNFAKPGWYHLRIDNVTEFTDYLQFTCLIVGTVPGNESEIGKTIKERLYPSTVFSKIVANIQVATGLATKDDIQKMKDNGTKITLAPNDLLGRSVVGHYKEEEYENKDGRKSKLTKIGFGWYHPESESAKNSGVKLSEAVIASAASDEFDAFA